jgi:hypothetical protein
MVRARLAIWGVLLLVVGAAAAGRAGAAPPPAAPTTVPTTTAVATTVAGSPAFSGPVVTAPLRGGAPTGTTAKPADELWSIRQIVTTVGSFVLGLALLGFVYGRIRSTAPRRNQLARTPE